MAKKKSKVSSEYQQFLKSKLATIQQSGFDVAADDINPLLFPFQRDIVRWALRLGKAAILAECGLGKTPMQLEWARHVASHTGGKVLILAPLAVAYQTVDEGVKFGIDVKQVHNQDEVGDSAIVICNYERLHLMDASQFVGVVLDESSILKAFMGKTKRLLIETFSHTPYKLACTATPAPNDYTEIGNHAEFLNIKKQDEMLATWFVNDSSDTGTWRLKKHAAKEFWRWLTSWAVCLSKPGDLGSEYDMPSFELPKLELHEFRLNANQASIQRFWDEGKLIPDDNPSSTGMHIAKRESLDDRVAQVIEIMETLKDQFVIVWCDTDYEADALKLALDNAAEVRGSDKRKEEKLKAFSNQEYRVIITKPDIAGFGLNWQHCSNQVFVGVSYSFEKTYQALRRSYRFGQQNPVHAYLIYAETEGNIMVTLKEKQAAFKVMQGEMNKAMSDNGLFRDADHSKLITGASDFASGANWKLYMGDCVQQITNVNDGEVDMSLYSPPFPDIFMYTDSHLDMGNVKNDAEFFEGYKFLVKELFRVTRDGRLSAVHCVDLPSFKYKHGHVGLRDFPGEIIRTHLEAGWIFHSRITIWKDPVTEMQRTKAHALLHKNFTAKSEQVRQGIPDYLLVFRKPDGENSEHVNQNREMGDYVGTEPPQLNEFSGNGKSHQVGYSIAVWQRYASPVWFDIDQSRTLNYRMAKDTQDEKHICPLQLDVIARSIDLWTNKGDTVFSPFAGIGSEGYEAIRLGRKFIGIELKESYWKHAQRYLQQAEDLANAPTLFDFAEAQGIEIESETA